MEAHRPEDSIAELLTTYNELNSSHIEELDEEPSPLEFMRYVARNTPFVVRRGAQDWTATRTWDAAYLRSTLAGHKVNVAITPYGNADSPTLDGRGHLVFAKPYEEDQQFSEFLEFCELATELFCADLGKFGVYECLWGPKSCFFKGFCSSETPAD
ncbi:hypothetical protein RRF57_006506 [Xylaria bambusicola]|uniref:Cupin-like domain-containing protein n=1 Tax=Xylaria bambusicola TaxID=326684 RepID=A0AAN7US86_9PEZI